MKSERKPSVGLEKIAPSVGLEKIARDLRVGGNLKLAWPRPAGPGSWKSYWRNGRALYVEEVEP